MAKKDLRDCRSQRDFLHYAEAHGAEIRNGGRHVKIRYNGYSVPVPDGELKTGTRHAIVKALTMIGLAAFALAWLLALGAF